MKIYTEINYEFRDGKLVRTSEESYEYDGEVAQCGGGSGSSKNTTTSYTASIPRWAEIPHMELIGSAVDESGVGYGRGYEGQRIAGWTSDEAAAMDARRAMFEGGDPYEDVARDMSQAAYLLPGQVSEVESRYGGIDPALLGNIGDSMRGDTGRRNYDNRFGGFADPEYYIGNDGHHWSQPAYEKYMDPYRREVIDQEIEAARDEFSRQDMQTEAQRISRGTRGGYRAALHDILGGNERAETIAGIEAEGQQRAFAQAGDLFEKDRSASMAAAQMTEQSLSAAQSRFNQNRDSYLRAVQMGDQAGMKSAQMGMDAARYNQDMIMKQSDAARKSAELESSLGDSSQARLWKQIQEKERVGAQRREMQQRALDVNYEDYMARRDWNKNQMNWLAGILAGVPGVVPEYTKRPAPSFASQAAGLGMGLAGARKLFGD